MEGIKSNLLFLLFSSWVLITAGCATTAPSTIETIEGPATNGVIARPLEIVGVLNLSTTSGNVPNASQSQFVSATVEVPVGTVVIVPAVKGWMLGYGEAQPNPTDPNNSINWQTEDHNWGLGNVEVSVVKINPPNTLTNPPTQTAELSIRFYLSDDNQDDSWFGAVSYHLLCLGVPGFSLNDWTPARFEPPKFIAVPNP
jgi:hypothetical protein